jgi:uncharacterized protein (DUF2141 family)
MCKTKTYIYFLFLLGLISCAIQVPPSGGPPDKTPPSLIEISLKNATLNFNGKSITFVFNKYMNKSLVMENLYVSPETEVNYNWSGKELELEFKKNLTPNTTYSISFGTDYSDLKGNKPTQAYNIIFSTGDKIDSGKIGGFVFDIKPEGSFIYAYKLDSINLDTLDIRHTKPDYRVQVGSSGKFEINALKNGIYRIFAIRDKEKNGVFDEGMDDFGSAENDVPLKNDSIPYVRLRIGPPIDRTQPQLYTIESVTNKFLVAEFSKTLDTNSISKNSFLLTDSLKTVNIDIISAFINTRYGNKIDLMLASPLDSSKKWLLNVKTDSVYCIKDSSGLRISDTASKAYFYASNEIDSSKFYLIRPSIKDSSQFIPTHTFIDFIFNQGIDTSNFNSRISLINSQSKNKITFKYLFVQDNILRISPATLEADNWYELKLNTESLRSINKTLIRDTSIRIKFKTIDDRSYGTLSGRVIDSNKFSGKYIVYLNSTSSKDMFFTVCGDSLKWEIKNIPPGSYKISVIKDSNGDSKYDYGNPFPYRHSEFFLVNPTEITIKPRWSLENFILKID